jgi:hypothetical protein
MLTINKCSSVHIAPGLLVLPNLLHPIFVCDSHAIANQKENQEDDEGHYRPDETLS